MPTKDLILVPFLDVFEDNKKRFAHFGNIKPFRDFETEIFRLIISVPFSYTFLS